MNHKIHSGLRETTNANPLYQSTKPSTFHSEGPSPSRIFSWLNGTEMVTFLLKLWCANSNLHSLPIQLLPYCWPTLLCSAKSLQLCLTLCDPRDSSPPGSPIPGILQVRTLEWVAISFSNAWQWRVKVKSLSRAWLLETPWTAADQAPPSMGCSRQEYWSEVPLPSLGDLLVNL